MSFISVFCDKIKEGLGVAGQAIQRGIDAVDDNVKIPIYHKFKEAREINERAQVDFDSAKRRINEIRELTQNTLEKYGRTKLQIYDTSLRNYVLQFERIKGVDFNSINAIDSMPSKILLKINLKEINLKFIDGVKALIAGSGAGAVSGAVAYGAVGMLASASTGTAISALSGAAATNATLAFLGGGSLAAGGGGVALGTAVLGGLIAIPVFIVGGFVLNAKSKVALENARENSAKVKQFVSEAEAAISGMNVIRERCNQMKSVLQELDSHLVQMVEGVKVMCENQINHFFMKRMLQKTKNFLAKIFLKAGLSIPKWLSKPVKVEYVKLSESEKNYLWIATSVAQTTKNVLDTDLLTSAGTITEKSQTVLEQSKDILKQLSY